MSGLELSGSELSGSILFSVIAIQAFWRGCTAKRKFSLPKREFHEKRYSFLPIGNGPTIHEVSPPVEFIGGPFSLITTGSLRAIDTALAISKNRGKDRSIPKIYLIDFQKRVIDFWKDIKKTFSKISSASEIEDAVKADIYTKYYFTEILKKYSAGQEHLVGSCFDVCAYLNALAETYSFEIIQRCIQNLCPILGSWDDATLFLKLNNILDTLGLSTRYLDPSNILSYGADFGGLNLEQFFQCIAILKPTAQLHSDYCIRLNKPLNVYFFSGPVSEAELRKKILPWSLEKYIAEAHAGVDDGLESGRLSRQALSDSVIPFWNFGLITPEQKFLDGIAADPTCVAELCCFE